MKTWFTIRWGHGGCQIDGPFGDNKDGARKYAHEQLFEMEGGPFEAIGVFSVDLEEVSNWSRMPGERTMAFRLTDGSGKAWYGTVVASDEAEAKHRVWSAASEHDLPAGPRETEIVILEAFPRVTFVEDSNSFGV